MPRVLLNEAPAALPLTNLTVREVEIAREMRVARDGRTVLVGGVDQAVVVLGRWVGGWMSEWGCGHW